MAPNIRRMDDLQDWCCTLETKVARRRSHTRYQTHCILPHLYDVFSTIICSRILAFRVVDTRLRRGRGFEDC